MAVCLLLLYAVLITPLRLSVYASHEGETRLLVCVRAWGIPFTWRIRSRRLRSGRVTTLLRNNHPPKDAPPDTGHRIRVIVGAYLRSNRARTFFQGHVRLLRLDALVHIALSDAAQTALAAGLLGALGRLFSLRMQGQVRLKVIPAFFQQQTTAQARCILFFRLGTILITAALAGAAYLLEKREHPPTRAKEA